MGPYITPTLSSLRSALKALALLLPVRITAALTEALQPAALLVTDTAVLCPKWVTLTLECHLGLCFLVHLHLSTLAPLGCFPASAPLTPPYCIDRLNNASESLKAAFAPPSFVVLPPLSSSEMYKMTGQINCKKKKKELGEHWNK